MADTKEIAMKTKLWMQLYKSLNSLRTQDLDKPEDILAVSNKETGLKYVLKKIDGVAEFAEFLHQLEDVQRDAANKLRAVPKDKKQDMIDTVFQPQIDKLDEGITALEQEKGDVIMTVTLDKEQHTTLTDLFTKYGMGEKEKRAPWFVVADEYAEAYAALFN